MSSYVATFSPDLSTPAVNQDFLALKAGDSETLTLLVEGFETDDSITSITLYAKTDPANADDAASTITLTATLTTPTRDPNARTATFSLSSANTTALLTGRVFRVEVIATRSAVPYTRTVMYGWIAATYPGSTVSAPSDEAYLRALGDATNLATMGDVAHGGTGVTAYTAGDMLYASATTTLSKLGIGASGRFLKSTGTAPSWALIVSSDISDATSTNTASRVVIRDASGNFAAGTITANITGNVTGNVTGNADTATALSSSRTFALTGDVTGTTSSTLSAGFSIALTLANGVVTNAHVNAAAAIAYSKLNLASSIVNADVSASAAIAYSKLNLAASIVNADISASAGIVDTKLATISTAGKVSNSATTATSANTASAIVARDASGNFSAGTITATLSGAAPADSLSGTTLASNVVTSSLTAVGILASPHMTSPVIDSGGLTVTLGASSFQALSATTGLFTSTVTVASGGISVTGASTITGTLSGITTLTATTLAGTLSTAAQPNVTSVGTLTSLAVTGQGTFGDRINVNVLSGYSLFNNANTTGWTGGRFVNGTADLKWGIESSAGGQIFTGTSANASVFGTGSATALQIVTNDTVRAAWSSAGLLTLSYGVTIASSTTLTLTGATVAGQPTWSSSQAITLSTAAQPNITSVGTLTSLTTSGAITMTAATSKIVPGATSWAVRNTADSADNLLITDAGIVQLRGASSTSGASAGDLILKNTGVLRAVNAGGTAARALVTLDANNVMQLGSATDGIYVAFPLLTGVSADSRWKGSLYADTGTAGQLVFFDGVTGARYKLTGTAF